MINPDSFSWLERSLSNCKASHSPFLSKPISDSYCWQSGNTEKSSIRGWNPVCDLWIQWKIEKKVIAITTHFHFNSCNHRYKIWIISHSFCILLQDTNTLYSISQYLNSIYAHCPNHRLRFEVTHRQVIWIHRNVCKRGHMSARDRKRLHWIMVYRVSICVSDLVERIIIYIDIYGLKMNGMVVDWVVTWFEGVSNG